nr:unnamed protein product [Callosobruchus chinensis]
MACINVQNDDQACFCWSIVSALYPKDENLQRTSVCPHHSVVPNSENIDSPMSLQKIQSLRRTTTSHLIIVCSVLSSRRVHAYLCFSSRSYGF